MAEAIFDTRAITMVNENGSLHNRRHSTGKFMAPNGGLTVFPRYLSTSQGSCHDLCKYGARFPFETDSKSPRSPQLPKIETLKRVAGRCLERSASNYRERRKSEVGLKFSHDFRIQDSDVPVVIKIAETHGRNHLENNKTNLSDGKKHKNDVKSSGDSKSQKAPDCSVGNIQPSLDDLVDIKTIAPVGDVEDGENAEPELNLKPPSDLKNQKALHLDCVESEALTSSTDKEIVLKKQVLSPVEEVDVVVDNVRDSKLKPQSKPSSLIRQTTYPSAKQKFEGRKGKEIDIVSVTSKGRLSGKSKGEMTKSKGIRRISGLGDAKNVEASSLSLFSEESGTSVSSWNAKKKNASGKNKGEMTISKEIRSGISDEKNVEASYLSLFSEESGTSVSSLNAKKSRASLSLFSEECGTSVSSLNAKKKKSRAKGVYQSVKQNIKQIKSETSCSMNAKGSKNQTGVSRLMDQENDNYEQASFAEVPEKTLYMVEPDPENKPAKSIQNSVHVHASDFSTIPSSSSKQKSVKRTRNVNPKGQSPRSYEKNILYRPKGIQTRRLLPSLSSSYGKKSLRSTPHGKSATQSSLTASSSSASSKFPHGSVPSEHDNETKQMQKGSLKTIHKGTKSEKGSKTTSKDKHSQGEKLKFHRGKVIEVAVQDSTPRRLKFKKRVAAENRNGGNPNDTKEEITPGRIKFKKRVLADNKNANDKQNEKDEVFTPRRLKFRQKVPSDNRIDDGNQNDRGEDCTPRKLKFRQRALDDNKNGHVQNNEGDTSNNNSEGKEDNVEQANANEVQSNKVSLRHKDAEKKKDLGGLYNNMIEETTSRLVRTKTSKVKALVSAFETVISHLDTGSPTNSIP